MSEPIGSLDAFLDGAQQRGLTNVIRKALAHGRGLTIVFGNGPAAERLITALARSYPEPHANLALVEVDPVRLTMGPQSLDPRMIEAADSTPSQLVRSLLRQDPDAIAVTRLEGADAPLLLNAVFTGHQLLLGSSAASLEDVIAALTVGSSDLAGHVRAALDLACELDERGLLRRVLTGDKRGGLVEAALVEASPEAVEAAPHREPHWAPPLESRPPATRSPRAAFLPETAPGVTGRSLLGVRAAHRPAGSPWPACGDCGAPMALIVQLDLACLPEPMPAWTGLAQLFLCTVGGCDVANEQAKGVLAELLTEDALALVEAPASLSVEVLEPGTIVGWRRFAEDPEAEDLARLSLGGEANDELPRPLRADKLGGWPAWEQGLEWPGPDYELLFQFAEAKLLSGGTPDRWDDATATWIPGSRPTPVLDPNQPCHFPSVLTAEAVAFLFWERRSGRLALRWQTG